MVDAPGGHTVMKYVGLRPGRIPFTITHRSRTRTRTMSTRTTAMATAAAATALWSAENPPPTIPGRPESEPHPATLNVFRKAIEGFT